MDLRKVSDQILLANMKNLASQERVLYTEVLHHLREIQRRRLFADLGQPSLFAYCVNILKYSNGEADRRIKAVAMIREMPAIEEKIVSGELSLTNVAKAKEFFNQEEKVAPMKPEAKLELIKKLENKSTREAEKILLAESSSPAPEVKERIRQVSESVAEVKFAADEKLLAKINRLKGLLAHKHPNMKTSELINTLCEIALDKLDPTRKAVRKSASKLVANPIAWANQVEQVHFAGSSNQDSRLSPAPEVKENPMTAKTTATKTKTETKRKYISLRIKREIWQRANGKCTNCKTEYALEIDHIRPISKCGGHETKNLRLVCRRCNQRAAISKIGAKMYRYLDQ